MTLTVILPSDLRDLVDQLFPAAKPSATRANFELGVNHAFSIAAIWTVGQQLDRSHFAHSSKQYMQFIAALAVLKTTIDQWHSGQTAYGVGRLGDQNAVVALRDALADCEDHPPLSSVKEFPFVTPEDMRVDMQRDMESARRALNSGEWKTATVLAGATMEALLLFGLQRLATVDAAKYAIACAVRSADPMDTWTLEPLLKAAEKVQLLADTTLANARSVQQFRNFIHPGKAVRTSQRCDRGTAFVAVGTVDRIARELQ